MSRAPHPYAPHIGFDAPIVSVKKNKKGEKLGYSQIRFFNDRDKSEAVYSIRKRSELTGGECAVKDLFLESDTGLMRSGLVYRTTHKRARTKNTSTQKEHMLRRDRFANHLLGRRYLIGAISSGSASKLVSIMDDQGEYDLDCAFTNGRKFSVVQVLWLVLCCMHEVRILHDANIYCLDIKPENIVVSSPGSDLAAHIVDFEGAYMRDNPEYLNYREKTDVDLEERIICTPGHLDEENFTQRRETGRSTFSKAMDIYALGLVAAELFFYSCEKKLFLVTPVDEKHTKPITAEVHPCGAKLLEIQGFIFERLLQSVAAERPDISVCIAAFTFFIRDLQGRAPDAGHASVGVTNAEQLKLIEYLLRELNILTEDKYRERCRMFRDILLHINRINLPAAELEGHFINALLAANDPRHKRWNRFSFRNFKEATDSMIRFYTLFPERKPAEDELALTLVRAVPSVPSA